MQIYVFKYTIRQTEGIIKATVGKTLQDHPSYGNIRKRINRLNVEVNYSNSTNNHDDVLIIAADSTAGINVTNSAYELCLKEGPC